MLTGIDTVIALCPKPRMGEAAAHAREAIVAQLLKERRAVRRMLLAQLDALRRARAASVSKLGAIDEDIRQLGAERRRLQQGHWEIDDPALALALSRLSTAARRQPLDHADLNHALRRVLISITIRYDEDAMELHWRHGGESFLAYDPTGLMLRPAHRQNRYPGRTIGEDIAKAET